MKLTNSFIVLMKRGKNYVKYLSYKVIYVNELITVELQ